MHCYSCGGYLTSIVKGGCGGSGEVAGCEKCDTVFQYEGGGICSSAHLVRSRRFDSFRELAYRESQRIKPHKLNSDYYKDHHPEQYNKWSWSELGYGNYHDHDTEEQAIAAIKEYVNKFHIALPWPLCDKCGKKPIEKIFGVVKCETCKRSSYGTTWHGQLPRPKGRGLSE